MVNPTTRSSTPPQSARIGQQVPPNAVVLQAYAANNFPGVAFTNQLAINLDDNTLSFFDDNNAWQGIVGAVGIQVFYSATEPTSGMRVDDEWYDTDNDNALSRWDGSAWVPMPFGSNAIANTITGKTIQTAYSGPRWEMTGGTTDDLIGYTGSNNEISPGFIRINDAGLAGYLELSSPEFGSSGPGRATVIVESADTGSPYEGRNIRLNSDYTKLTLRGLNQSWAWSGFNEGALLRGLVLGQLTATTDGSGVIDSIGHDLGVTPLMVIAMSPDNSNWVVTTGSYSSTDWNAHVHNIVTNTTVDSTSVTLNYIIFT